MTNAGCSFICSVEYLIDSVHPVDTHTHTQPRTHTHTFVIFHVAVTQQEQSEDVTLKQRKEDECVPVSVTALCARWGEAL